MKTTFKLFSAALLSAALVSCGGKIDEEAEKPATNPLEALVQAGEEMEKAANEGEAKMKERRAKGDTLAMPYAELQKYLPRVDGFKAEEPSGSNIDMPGMSYSSAEAKYTKDDGTWIKVTIVDYNQAYSLYSAATAMWAMGMSVDTPTEKAGGLKFEGDIGGWETFHKQNKVATVVLGVGSRFWVSVEGEKQEGTDFVKSVAKLIDLKKLSAL
jgi:hypothetical protein